MLKIPTLLLPPIPFLTVSLKTSFSVMSNPQHHHFYFLVSKILLHFALLLVFVEFIPSKNIFTALTSYVGESLRGMEKVQMCVFSLGDLFLFHISFFFLDLPAFIISFVHHHSCIYDFLFSRSSFCEFPLMVSTLVFLPFPLLVFRECVTCPYSSNNNSAIKCNFKGAETGARLCGFKSFLLVAM